MKISISTQKKIMWIPIIHIFSLFVWLYNYIYYPHKSFKLWWGSIGYTFLHMIPAIIVHAILNHRFPEMPIVFMITTYFCFLSMSYALIRWQKKNIESEE